MYNGIPRKNEEFISNRGNQQIVFAAWKIGLSYRSLKKRVPGEYMSWYVDAYPARRMPRCVNYSES